MQGISLKEISLSSTINIIGTWRNLISDVGQRIEEGMKDE
jgi:hypothetical protein